MRKTQSFLRRISQGGTLAAGIALLFAAGCNLAEAEEGEDLVDTNEDVDTSGTPEAIPPTVGVGGGQVAMCHLTFDPVTFELIYEDILVEDSAVAGHLAQGDLLGTCAAFLCNAS